MKDHFQDFKEDLDFLIATYKESSDIDASQYPDLLQLQSFMRPKQADTVQVQQAEVIAKARLRGSQPSENTTVRQIAQSNKLRGYETELDVMFEEILHRQEGESGSSLQVEKSPALILNKDTEPAPLFQSDQKNGHKSEESDNDWNLNIEDSPDKLIPALKGPGHQNFKGLEDTAHRPLPEKGNGQTKTKGESEQRGKPLSRKAGLFQKLEEQLQRNAFAGVDIGALTVKFISLHKSTTGITLASYFCVNLPDVPPELNEMERKEMRQAKAVEILQGKFRKTDHIASVISGLEVIYRLLLLPKMSRKELAEAVPWAIRKDLPYELDNARIGYEVSGVRREKRIEKLKVPTVIAPYDVVAQHLEIYQKISLLPVKVTAVPVAIWNVIQKKKELARKRILVVEIGASTSHLIFINEGTLDFHREITTAGKDFIDAIANSVYYDPELAPLTHSDAATILQQYGIPKESSSQKTKNGISLSEIGVNVRPVLERLVSEIRRSMDYYREKFKIDSVDHIFISGGGACIQNLAVQLQEALGEPVEILNPFELAGIRKWEQFAELAQIAPRFTVPVGLALDQNSELNLLPEALQSVHKARKFRRFLRYIVLAAFLGLGLVSGWISLQMQKFSSDLRHVQAEYQKMEPLRNEFMVLKKKQDSLKKKQKLYQSKIFVNTTAANHLRAISNLVPPYIALTSLAIEPVEKSDESENKKYGEKVTLRGIAFPDRALEGSNLAAFLLKLQRSGYFQAIEMVGQETSSDGTITFVLNCYY